MALRYPLTPLGREALWEAYGRLCYYCRASISLRGMEADHVVAGKLGKADLAWLQTCNELGLPVDFDIEDIGNLVAACRRCNGDKGSRPLSPGRVAIDLSAASARKKEIEKRFEILRRKDQRERARTAVAVAISQGAMSLSDLRDFERSYVNDQGLFRARLGWLFEQDRLVDVAKEGLEALLDEPVNAEPLDGRGLILVEPEGEEIETTTLRAYKDAIGRGFYAATTFTMHMEAIYFERPLILLELIATAKHPETSFIDNPRLGLCDLDCLPAVLLFVTEEMTFDEAFAGQRAVLEGLTIQDVVDRGDAKIRSVSSQHLQVDYAGGVTLLLELMRADTNDDGYEELVLHRGGGPSDGTAVSARVMALSIQTEGGSFVEVPLQLDGALNTGF